LDREIYHILIKHPSGTLTHVILLLDFSEDLSMFYEGYSYCGRLLKRPRNIAKKLKFPNYNYDTEFHYRARIDNKSITQIIYDYKGYFNWIRAWIIN